MTPDDPHAEKTAIVRKGVRPLAVGIGMAILAAGALGLYGMAQPAGKAGAPATGACAKSLDLARKIAPLIHGEVAALGPASQPNDMSTVAFEDADGKKTSVAAFKGKTILLNVWATWCVPCRTEMPSLDKLQADLGSKDFSVVPVSADTTRLEKAKGFFKDIGASHLPYYGDPSGDILQVLKRNQGIDGLPTTMLIGPDGCAIATLAGPAKWDSPDAETLIKAVAPGAV